MALADAPKVVVESQSGVAIVFNNVQTYWRQRTTVDVVIAHHRPFSCFEVIVYCPDLDKVSPRIYLDARLIERRNAKHLEDDAELSPRPHHPNNRHDASAAAVDFILSRLFIEKMSEEEFKAAVGHQTGDTVDPGTQVLDAVLYSPPEGLLPVNVVRFFKKCTLSSQQFTAACKEQCAKLKHVSQFTAVAASSEAMWSRCAKYKYLPLPRVRWIKAINKVLAQLYVTRVKSRLRALEASKRKSASPKNDSNGRPRILRRVGTESRILGLDVPSRPATATAIASSKPTSTMHSIDRLPYLSIHRTKADSAVHSTTAAEPRAPAARRRKSMTFDGHLKPSVSASPKADTSSHLPLISLSWSASQSSDSGDCRSPLSHSIGVTHRSSSQDDWERPASAGPTPRVPTLRDSFIHFSSTPCKPVAKRAFNLEAAIELTLACHPE